MKFALTITEASPSELAKLLSLLGGTSALTVAADASQMLTAATGDDAGDDNGPVNQNAPATDKDGLPWDERIHSSNKQMTDKGVWRKRRGVSNEVIAQVEAELRAKAGPGMPTHQPQPAAPAIMPAPQPVPMQPPAAAPVATMPAPQPQPMPQPVPMQPPQNGGYPTGPGYPAQPGNVVSTMPGPAAQPAPAAAPPAMDFPTFMQALSGQMAKRDGNGMPLIDTDYLARLTSEIGTGFGVPLGVITDIVSQPRAAEMIVYAVQCLSRDGKWN